MPDALDVTRLLHDVKDGRRGAADELIPLVYAQLRSLAGTMFRGESPGHTLQPTALVHEAYLKLVDQTLANYQDRRHFFAVAATVMRRILVDRARERGRQKRGGDQQRVELDAAVLASEAKGIDLIDLDRALSRLEELDSRKAQVVELRFFSGMSVEDVAGILDISEKTVKREWSTAKGWLYRELSGDGRGSTEPLEQS